MGRAITATGVTPESVLVLLRIVVYSAAVAQCIISVDMATRQVWDEIAEGWYRLRRYSRFQGELREVARRWGSGRLLNIGCAHGADFLPFQDGFEMWGADFSRRLLELGLSYQQQQGFHALLVQAEASRLPFPDSSFQWAIAVAVYHHIRGEAARGQAWGELYRVLHPGGEAFITVWNRGQPRFWLQGREAVVPWRLTDGEVPRYHYLYTYRGLKRALQGAGFEVVALSPERGHRLPFKSLSRNICALVRRP